MKNNMRLFIRKAGIVAVWLGVWQAACMVTGLEFILPSPVTVFLTLIDMLQTKEYYISLFYSLRHIGLGFAAALFSGIVLGSLSAAFKIVRELLEPLILLMKSLPVAAFIILVLIWFGSKNAAVFISFTVAFPMIYYGVSEGICNTDKKLLEMADIFRISFYKRVRYIYVGQVYPFLSSNLKTAIGMCWKAGISAEVIGLVDKSIGEQLYYTKLYLMTAELFAWSVTIIVISFILERFLKWLLELICRKISRSVV